MKPNSHNQKGQVIIEYILMMVVMLTASFALQKWLKESAFAQNFTVQPWARLNGMVQCGVWSPCGIGHGKPKLHSNGRLLSLKPELTP
jgi:hypothetical protein